MATKIHEAALLHLLLGMPKPDQADIPAGDYDLSDLEVTLRTPHIARVTRAGGSEGDGFNSKPVAAPTIVLDRDDLLLILKESGAVVTPELAAKCIRARLNQQTIDVPREIMAGVAIVQAEQPSPPEGEKELKATPINRTGQKEITLTWKRIPKPKAATVK